MTPTPEQQAIIDLATSTNDNILISALAGAAKTSTLVLLANALPTQTLCIAFNKRIADEMQTRLPEHCKAQTLNSLGHRTWMANIGKKAVLDTKKVYRLTRSLIDRLSNPKEKQEAFDSMSDIMKAVEAGKTCGYIPDEWHGPMTARPLMDDAEFFQWLDVEPTDLEWEMIKGVTAMSLTEGFGVNGPLTIDFSDQLLLPTVFPVSFTIPPLVMIDEAQDLSALNHAMVSKFAKRRLIAVGDECQSIYGFRGAHEESMALMEKQFNMTRMLLSISFRCPISIVEAAQWRAPHMRYPNWAKQGEVRHWAEWTAPQLPDTAVILCRNNAPLFGAAIRLLKNGRYPELVGNDIGKSLIKILKKFGDESMSQATVLAAIETWKQEKLRKSRSPAKVEDQAECLRIFARQGKNLGESLAYASDILARSGPVKLMTGHKSKGLEWPDVFILDEHLIGDEPQEKNLRYVMITRAKETLTYITSEEFLNNDEIEESADGV